MKLVDMHHEPAQGEGMEMPAPCDYPYGLRINLREPELAALGMDGLPPAGTKLHGEFRAVVTRSSSEDPDADGDIDYVCVELQLTELGVEEEVGNVERRQRKARVMYGE